MDPLVRYEVPAGLAAQRLADAEARQKAHDEYREKNFPDLPAHAPTPGWAR